MLMSGHNPKKDAYTEKRPFEAENYTEYILFQSL